MERERERQIARERPRAREIQRARERERERDSYLGAKNLVLTCHKVNKQKQIKYFI